MAKPAIPSIERHKPLSKEINEATRKPHTNLNQLITARLPLALPPHTTTPMLYARGLLHFAHIYLTFETLWLSLLHSPTAMAPALELLPTKFPLSDLHPVHCVQPSPSEDHGGNCASTSRRVQAFLERLLLPGLMRSERLKEDLGYLTGLGAAELAGRLDRPEGKRAVEAVAHIRSTILDKPHVLIAYAWVMYMAIFSGGRWMRAQLLLAGPDFWSQPSTLAKPPTSSREARKTTSIQFFHFEGPEDGEDIKQEFKRRFTELDQLLTPDERQDVVSEALQIFHYITMMVEELDGLYGQSIVSSGGFLSREVAKSSSLAVAAATHDAPCAKQTTEKLAPSAPWIGGSKSWVVSLMDEGTVPSEKQTITPIMKLATLIVVLSVCLWFLLSRAPF
ncbi:hypothetical protein FGG08_005004 [Glutinoglossum americanum]|uniref:Heme oxygenase n=1 Tax=Glutinoglossum americanum TaxID=1670608 RepID=A0A9P8I826_9PEZI|nr:hypothetical protein FGG08_005004 [Glutinoglossum americanum]